jgi:enoyl-CoA hydratase
VPDFENLDYAVSGRIATITINRPDKLNALNRRTLEELGRATERAGRDPDVGGLIITGQGMKAFAAGADIAELKDLTPLQAIELSRLGQDVFRAIELSRKPVIGAVNGFALGGGCELALACHLRVASSDARFGLPEVKLGIIPGYGGTLRLPRIVGKARALEMILTGEMVDAAEAHRIGLVSRLAEPEMLLQATRELLDMILANGPLAVGFAIQAVTRGFELAIEDGLSMESNLFGLLAGTDDVREGMSAFLEKRRAQFQGR